MLELSSIRWNKGRVRRACLAKALIKKIRATAVVTIGIVLLVSVSPATAQDELEKRFIESTKNIPVTQFDPRLPAQPLSVWLDSVADSPSKVVWEVNDCGEQTGSPADTRRDFPACVEAIVVVTPEVKIHISIIVGTFKQGITGQARLFQAFVERNGKYQRLEQLSDILEIAQYTRKIND